ncbi:uncharacterized protein DSM5745_00760 [Aspergillus mulundensis]|uniref:Uncharacterized protein n=1 Tax=Aspergillus mulundensis TaxID=1810919 RepID=A0A3D8T5Z6_9EURO|nr:hypothetical protein DSM5745_00760 [Aspergillus mulundensis]RDW93438.1 hypothetical protein DSM5745_00760 [Aspergillus mulundensis]
MTLPIRRKVEPDPRPSARAHPADNTHQPNMVGTTPNTGRPAAAAQDSTEQKSAGNPAPMPNVVEISGQDAETTPSGGTQLPIRVRSNHNGADQMDQGVPSFFEQVSSSAPLSRQELGQRMNESSRFNTAQAYYKKEHLVELQGPAWPSQEQISGPALMQENSRIHSVQSSSPAPTQGNPTATLPVAETLPDPIRDAAVPLNPYSKEQAELPLVNAWEEFGAFFKLCLETRYPKRRKWRKA